MIRKQVRTRLVIGTLVTTLLLSAGVIFARSRIRTEVLPGPVKRVEELAFRPVADGSAGAILTFGLPLGASSDRIEGTFATGSAAVAPTFVGFRSVGAGPADPTPGAPSSAPAAKTPIAPPEDQRPGAVKNLRRTDRQ